MWFEVPVSKTIEYDLSILYGKVRRVSLKNYVSAPAELWDCGTRKAV